MRLFTGLALEPTTLRHIEGILAELRRTADLRWSPPANLHITTAFIGSWEEARLPELQAALAQLELPRPIPISITGFGYFPNPQHPHSLFLAVAPEAALSTLSQALEHLLTNLECRRGERVYTPHVTLARMAGENITQLALSAMRFKTASMHNLFPLPGFEATAFHLYESRATPGGSVYSTLATFPAGESAL